MGNSKAKPGVYIQTERPFYLPGEVVTGNVYINAPQPYPTSKLVLSIQGTEKTWWRGGRQDVRKNVSMQASSQSLAQMGGMRPNQMQIPISGDRFGECKIIDANFVLNNWGQSANLHGQFVFPFQFMLPNFVPGSFKEQTTDYKASITYQIRCVCVSSKKPEDNIVTKQELIVRQPKKKAQQLLYGEVYLYPETCCCMKKGVSRICCYFEKNQYTPGEQCVAICQADNYKCELDIRQIKVKFKKVVTLTSGFGEQKVFIQDINRASFPGVQAFNQYTGQAAQKISIPLKYRDSKISMHPTTNGKMVKCHYYFEVTPQMKGWFVKKINSFQVALNILQQGLTVPTIQQPQGWNPQVHRKSQIMLNQNYSNQFIDQMGNKNYF